MDIRKFIVFFVAAVSFCGSAAAIPQNEGYDVFIPIAKYIRQGDADKLSAWFDSNLEISIISNTSDSSKNPRGFDITHTAGRANMKYAVGRLNAGGETFEVTIFVTFKKDSYKIQQLKIMREK